MRGRDRLSRSSFGTARLPAFPFAATYVINLRDSADRWESMTDVLKRTGLSNVVRWEGVDGRRFDAAFVRTLQSLGVLATDLSRFTAAVVHEEVGCALSHVGVLRDIVRRRLHHALILEDDVVPTEGDAGWRERFARTHADLPRSWEMWFLYRCHDRQDKLRRRTPRTVIPYQPYGAAAYAVSERGAAKLLRAVSPIRQPIDCMFAEDLVRTGRVRRAKLYYLRGLKGKAARLRERE